MTSNPVSVLINWFLPADQVSDDLVRCRLLVALCFTAGGTLLLSATLRAWLGPATPFISSLPFLAAAILLFAPLVLRLRGSSSGLVMTVAFGELTMLIVYTHLTGGLNSVGVLWYTLLPLACTFYIGIRWALVIAVILIADAVALFGIEFLLAPVDAAAVVGLPVARLTTVIASIVLTMMIGVAYIRLSDRLRDANLVSQGELQRMNLELESKVKERTSALAARITQLAHASDVAKLSFWEWDLASSSLRFSHGGVPVSGMESVTVRGFLEMVHQEDREHLTNTVERSIRENHAFELEFRLWVDEAIVWLRVQAERVVDPEHPEEFRFVGVSQDVTAEKQRHTRQIDERKREALGAVASGIAHDFNNILTPIQGFAELTARRTDDPDIIRYTKMISSASERAANLVAQMLAFARQSKGNPKAVDLAQMIREVVDLLRPSLSAEIRLDLPLADNLPPIWADPVQIQSVLMNLLMNARDAMPTGGVLAVELSEASLPDTPAVRYQRVVVSDTGVGMPAEARERMFDPYFSTKTPGRGTGLGLALVDGVIRELGGSIEATSTPDEGTSIMFTIPERMRTSSAPARRQQRISTPGHVLLVDDDESVLEIARIGLSSLGHVVYPYSDPLAALEAIGREDVLIDLIVSDEVMPGLDGISLVKQARVLRPGVRVMMIGGSMDPDLLEANQISNFLQKPFTLTAFGQAIEEAMASGADMSGVHATR